MQDKRHIYTSIDIGSDSIKVVVCELYRGRYNLLAASSVRSSGIKKGLITDVSLAKDSILKAFAEVEAILGFKIKQVIAIIPSYFAEFEIIKGEIAVNNETKTITGREVINVLQCAMKESIVPAKEMITIMPIDFKVDAGITKEPIGLVSNSIATRAVLITTPKKNIISVVNLLNNIGVEVVDISLGCIGDIYTFRTQETDSNVSAVINIGAEKTEVTFYNKGIAVKHGIVNMGSKNVDSDISYMYKLDLETACQLKEKFALAHKMNASLNETKEVTTKSGEVIKINQYEISEIASSRIDEILTLSLNTMTEMTSRRPDRIFITGGITNMANFYQICREKFGNCAIIGNVTLIGLRNNKYSQAIGNIIYFVNKLKLKGTDYSMITNEDMEILANPKKSSNDSMIGKIFDYFFGE